MDYSKFWVFVDVEVSKLAELEGEAILLAYVCVSYKAVYIIG